HGSRRGQHLPSITARACGAEVQSRRKNRMTRSNRRVLLAVALAAAAMPSAAAELVANGGFETGDLAPWFTAVPGNPGLCALGWNVSDVGGSEATSCQPGVYGGTFPGPPFLGSFAA